MVIGLQKDPTGESGERRVAHGSLHAVEIHVLGSLHRVITARDHVLVTHRFGPIVFGVFTGNRVQSDLRVPPPFEHPDMVTVLVFDDAWQRIAVAAWHAVKEHPRWLYQMIIDRQDLHVILQRHGHSSLGGAGRVPVPLYLSKI